MKNILIDYSANKGNIKGIFVMIFFRIVQSFSMKKFSFFWWLGLPLAIVYRILVDFIMGIELKPNTVVGAGLRIEHGFALVVNKNAVIGKNVLLRHSTTIGCKRMNDGSEGSSPIIGNNVDVGAHVAIIGDIKIGDNVKIGVGTIIVKDVPDNVIIVGNPAKIIG